MPTANSGDSGAPPRILIVSAAALATALAVTAAVIGLTAANPDDSAAPVGPLPLVPVPAPQSGAPGCAAALAGMPATLASAGTELPGRELAEPAPAATVAWGTGDPVVLRCGLDRPPELTRDAPLREINKVRWLQVEGPGTSTWFVVDREVTMALTVPDTAGTGPLQQVSDAVATALPAVPRQF